MSTKVPEVALTQIIPQDDLNFDYVNRWKNEAEIALKTNRNITQITRYKSPGANLFHWKKSSVSGVWFFSRDNISIKYLYAYQGLQLNGIPKAAEALPYIFYNDSLEHDQVRGVTRTVFFDHILPDQKFVVTDSIYTQDNKRWFDTMYDNAFIWGHKIYAIELPTSVISEISPEEFYTLNSLYWGQDTEHQKYRFAISLSKYTRLKWMQNRTPIQYKPGW